MAMEVPAAAEEAAASEKATAQTIPVRNVPRQPQLTRTSTSTTKATIGAAMLWTGAVIVVSQGFGTRVIAWVKSKVA